MILQLVALAGAALVLAAYALMQRGAVEAWSPLYNWLNLVGALLLLWVAVSDRRWGFILLEGVWAALALPSLLRPRRSAGFGDECPGGAE